MRPGRVLVAAACALLLVAPALRAQQCEFLPGGGTVAGDILFDGSPVTYFGTPRLLCQGGMRISADSAVFYPASQFFQLTGRVSFRNTEIQLQGQNAQYYSEMGRISAQGQVRLVRLADSTVVTGESLEYIQIGPLSPVDRLTVTGGRPRAVLQPPRSEGAAADTAQQPFEVTANQIVVQGSNNFTATGMVEVRRGELEGYANRVEYFGSPGQLLLQDEARLGTDAYDLSGQFILIQMPNDEIESVLVRNQAKLVNDRLSLGAPLIQLIMADGVLERLLAGPSPEVGVSDGPAIAVTDGFSIQGTSLEIVAPNDVLESVLASGQAHAISGTARPGDETLPELVRQDRIFGDTILAIFAPPDTTTLPEGADVTTRVLESLSALLNASALYRMPPADTTGQGAADPDAPARFAVHYVRGDTINISFENGEVRSLDVYGQVVGQHMEPPALPPLGPPTVPLGPDGVTPPPAGGSPGNAAPPPGPAMARLSRATPSDRVARPVGVGP